MCIFTGRVTSVSATQIFARMLDGDRQALVYSMAVDIDEPVAMVIPIPVVPGSPDGAVTFVDLARYPDLFEDLAKTFIAPRSSGPLAPASLSGPPLLTVHRVGAFVASYVPSPRDFDRVDPRFRMPAPVLASHAEYADWGFVVFQLAPGAEVQTIHPMALTYPTRQPRALYFPTLHVHDGATVPDQAHFDHTLLCQVSDPVLARTLPWATSRRRAWRFVNRRRAKQLVASFEHVRRTSLHGVRANTDTWIDPPSCAGPHVLTGRGEHFEFDVTAGAAYRTENPRWRETARARLDDLHAGMLAGLTALTRDKLDAWELAPVRSETWWQRLRGDVPLELWLSNGALFGPFGPKAPVHIAAGARGRYAIRISASTDRVEPQTVRFVFRVAPTADRIAEIERAFAHILDRAVA